MKAYFRNLFAPMIGVMLSGCASVINGQNQDILIETACMNRQTKAYCSAAQGETRFDFSTPARITVARLPKPLEIRCDSSISGVYGVAAYPFPSLAVAGNVAVGGLVGVLADGLSNSMWQYNSRIEIEIPWCSSLGKFK